MDGRHRMGSLWKIFYVIVCLKEYVDFFRFQCYNRLKNEEDFVTSYRIGIIGMGLRMTDMFSRLAGLFAVVSARRDPQREYVSCGKGIFRKSSVRYYQKLIFKKPA